MNTMHFGEKYRQAVLDGFRQRSYTESSMNHDLDLEFSGARTVHVLSLQTEPLQDYDRAGDLAEGSRFGQTKEVGDFEQTFTMTQDKSLSLSVDKGNNAEQFNVKKAGAIMAAERDEHVVPELDRYRLEQWARQAGIHKALTAAPTKQTIVTEIVELHNEMLNRGVPEEGGTLFIQRAYVPALKLSTEWTGLDSLGGKSLPSGSIGMVDGLAVKPVPTSRFPQNCYFLIVHRSAVIAPIKIQSFKGHTDPPRPVRRPAGISYDSRRLCPGAQVQRRSGRLRRRLRLRRAGGVGFRRQDHPHHHDGGRHHLLYPHRQRPPLRCRGPDLYGPPDAVRRRCAPGLRRQNGLILQRRHITALL